MWPSNDVLAEIVQRPPGDQRPPIPGVKSLANSAKVFKKKVFLF